MTTYDCKGKGASFGDATDTWVSCDGSGFSGHRDPVSDGDLTSIIGEKERNAD